MPLFSQKWQILVILAPFSAKVKFQNSNFDHILLFNDEFQSIVPKNSQFSFVVQRKKFEILIFEKYSIFS